MEAMPTSTGAAGSSGTDEQQVSFGSDGTLHVKHVTLGKNGEYLGSPFLAAEPERLKAVACCYQGPQLSTLFYNAVGRLVTTVFDMPIGTVAFIDDKFAEVQGAAGVSVVEPTPREYSICTWTLIPLKPEVLVVEDLTTDGRYACHPVVCQKPHIRFYASAPLVTSTGFRLGTLCCLDFKPRRFSAECANVLCNLAELIMQEIEAQVPPPSSSLLYRAQPRERQAVLLLDLKCPGWKVLFGTALWPVPAANGSTPSESKQEASNVDANTQLSCSLEGTAFWNAHVRLGAGSTDKRPWQQYTSLVRCGQAFQLVVRSKHDTSKLLCLDMRPANTAKVWDDAVDVLVSSQGLLDDSSPNVRGLYFAVLLNCEPTPEQPVSATEGLLRGRSSTGTQRAGSISSEGSLDDSSTTALWQPTPMPDVHIGPLLGHGAYGRVYLGKMDVEGSSSAIVAVKVIPHRHVGGARPLRGASGAEGQIGLRLQHPHVICTYKFATFDHSARFPHANPSKRARSQEGLVPRNFPGQGDGLHSWIVLEYCNYGTLQSVIDKGMLRTDNSTWKGGPDMRVVLTVAHDVASAMAYLHEQGVLHGDLGPKNVLLVRDDMRSPPFIAKVSDFGLAHELAVDASLVTHTYGTVTHMPVELVCNGTLTAAVDVYAFGVMLWELYTGRRPFAGFNPVQLVAQKLMGGLLLTFDVPTPEPFRALAEACMSKDPAQRPSFAQVVNELKRLQVLMEQGLLQPGEFSVWGDPQQSKLDMANQLHEVGLATK